MKTWGSEEKQTFILLVCKDFTELSFIRETFSLGANWVRILSWNLKLFGRF